jgi:ATP-dependent protease HslVU (ClpYQ) peptidase subunit
LAGRSVTCVLGIEHPGGVLLASDSYTGDDQFREAIDRPKWFYRSPTFAIAYAGDFRPAQVIEFCPPFRKQKRGEACRDYLVRVVADGFRRECEARGVKMKNHDNAYLLAFRGLLYTLQEDFSLVRSNDGYSAIGGGQNFALGALAATASRPARERARLALFAAAKHSNAAIPPYYYVDVPR